MKKFFSWIQSFFKKEQEKPVAPTEVIQLPEDNVVVTEPEVEQVSICCSPETCTCTDKQEPESVVEIKGVPQDKAAGEPIAKPIKRSRKKKSGGNKSSGGK